MALQNGSIPVDATYAPTGGTARAMSLLAASGDTVKILLDEGLAYNLRRVFDISTTEPSAIATNPGGFGPRKVRISLKSPKQTADLKVFINQVNHEWVLHPETTAVDIDKLKSIMIAAITDADFDSLIRQGSKA